MSFSTDPERIISVVRLPDGSYDVRNERDLADLTSEQEERMMDALILWFRLRWRKRRGARGAL